MQLLALPFRSGITLLDCISTLRLEKSAFRSVVSSARCLVIFLCNLCLVMYTSYQTLVCLSTIKWFIFGT